MFPSRFLPVAAEPETLEAQPEQALDSQGSLEDPITGFGIPLFQDLQLGSLLLNSGLQAISNQNSWVGAAIHLNKRFTSSVPPAIKRKDSEELIPIEDTNYNFLRVPNTYSDIEEILEATSFWLDVLGEAFIFMEKDSAMSIPTAIHSIPPYLLQLKQFGNAEGAKWFFHSITAGRDAGRPVEPWELIHVKNYGVDRSYGGFYYNAYGHPLRGSPPARPLIPTITTDRKASNFIDAYTGGKTLLSGIIKPSSEVRFGRGQVEQIMANIQQQINNFTESQKLLMFQSQVDFIESNFRPFDIPYELLKKITKQEVCAIFGVNPVLLGDVEDIQSYEGIKTAEKVYYHREIIPRLTRLASLFYNNLFMFVNGGRERLVFDFSKIEALDDYDIRLERAQKALQLGRTPNEVNKQFRLGFPEETEWGDEPLPLFRQMDELEMPEVKKRDSADPDEKKDTDRPRKKKENMVALEELSDDDRRYLSDWENLAAKMERGMGRILMSIRGEVLTRIRDMYPQNELGDMPLFNYAAREAEMSRFFAARYREGFSMAQVQIVNFNPDSPVRGMSIDSSVQLFLREKVDAGERIVTSAREKLADIVRNGIRSGLDHEALASKIREEFQVSRGRARVIARTETSSVLNYARFQFMNEDDQIKRHRWITLADGKVRDSHARINGSVAAIGQPFPNGLRFPHDPQASAREVVNCRCWAEPFEIAGGV